MEKRQISSRYRINTRSIKVPARHIDGVYERPIKISQKKTKVVLQEKPSNNVSNSNKQGNKNNITSTNNTVYQTQQSMYSDPPIVHRVIHEYYQTVNSQPVPITSYQQYAPNTQRMMPAGQVRNPAMQNANRPVYRQPMVQTNTSPAIMYPTAPMTAPKKAPKKTILSKVTKKLNKSPKNAETKSNKLNPSDIIRYAVVTVFVVLAGYLAYDTWQTNQQVQSAVNGDSASAQSYESSADVSNPPISNGEAYPEYKVAADQPRILTIPSVNITARMMSVGLTGSNKVEVPSDSSFAGWYSGASKPGESGASFVTGHYNGPNAGGVFDNLSGVGIGDQIMIEMGDGSIIRYEVKEREVVPVSQVDMAKALRVVNGEDEGLNIMTCAGAFTSGGFTDRLTLYAERV